MTNQFLKFAAFLLVSASTALISSGGDGEGPQFKEIKSKSHKIFAQGGDGVGPRGPKGGKPEGGDGAGPRKNV